MAARMRTSASLEPAPAGVPELTFTAADADSAEPRVVMTLVLRHCWYMHADNLCSVLKTLTHHAGVLERRPAAHKRGRHRAVRERAGHDRERPLAAALAVGQPVPGLRAARRRLQLVRQPHVRTAALHFFIVFSNVDQKHPCLLKLAPASAGLGFNK